jgi:hypothetical protein
MLRPVKSRESRLVSGYVLYCTLPTTVESMSSLYCKSSDNNNFYYKLIANLPFSIFYSILLFLYVYYLIVQHCFLKNNCPRVLSDKCTGPPPLKVDPLLKAPTFLRPQLTIFGNNWFVVRIIQYSYASLPPKIL